ncbi:MAG: hypothetical protein ACR2F2_04235 [Pyrinomonadaceae bacterium]
MKFKFLTVLSLAAVAGLAGCGGDKTNTANINDNANVVVTNTTTAPVKDAAVQAAVEDALKKAGITDVSVDATTTGVTLRGTGDKDKMAEAVRVAQEAGKKPVKNELTEKK